MTEPLPARRRGPRTDALRNDALILRAAARVLAQDPAATMQRIADEAGVVRLTVYRRYRTRDALRTAVFEVAAAEAGQAVERARSRQADTLTTLRALIVEMARIAQRYPLIVVGTDLKPLPGQGRRPAPPPATRALHRTVHELVLRGQQEGVLRTDLPAELFPLAMTGTLNTAVRFTAALGLDPEALGAQIADLVLSGTTPRTAAAQPVSGQ
ncbi:TetR/AcrR family transcriptional regulator [Nocardia sp. alder85J]|uniref:TetR/AcrR family transcriptional regulator n=1 Tax=Nocardia sp. alder85J TaxID=2862949 RepID=UPI001CD2B355|nr:TetR/AcrR family transcriptional regulator [Nocardia sp. alder85J]MCX4091712.1 TetR/AcrR family transcriptional regulator [Nocardia sp. alder85J]